MFYQTVLLIATFSASLAQAQSPQPTRIKNYTRVPEQSISFEIGSRKYDYRELAMPQVSLVAPRAPVAQKYLEQLPASDRAQVEQWLGTFSRLWLNDLA